MLPQKSVLYFAVDHLCCLRSLSEICFVMYLFAQTLPTKALPALKKKNLFELKNKKRLTT